MLADRYLGIIAALETAGVRYVVVGGIAINLHGYARFTKDLDLILDLEASNAERGMQALASRGMRPRLPVDMADFADPEKRDDWFEHRNMLVFQAWHPNDPFCSVDIFIRNPIDFDELWARSQVDKIGAIPCRIASIADLISMKRMANREQDARDIEALQQIQRLQSEQS